MQNDHSSDERNRQRLSCAERSKALRHWWMWQGAALLAVGLFLLLPRLIPIPGLFGCPMHDLLHLYCPFCGGTRAVKALLQGDIAASWACYPPLFPLGILAAAWDLTVFVRLIGYRRPPVLPGWLSRILPWLLPLLLIGFAVLRNWLMIARGVDPIGDLSRFWHPV